MRHRAIVGAGSAGTMVAGRLRRGLPSREWRITVVDHGVARLSQPGLLFVSLDDGKTVAGEVDRIDPAARLAGLAGDRSLGHDFLVIPRGAQPRPDQTPGGGRLVVHLVGMLKRQPDKEK